MVFPCPWKGDKTKSKILYIEDNQRNLYLVTFLLSAKGYEVIQALDGQEGIDLAVQHKPDLILLDIHLPKMDGYEVARILRSYADLAKIPVIALTSYVMAGDREKALAAGCTGYIEEPINLDSFVAQIEQYLPGTESPGGGE